MGVRCSGILSRKSQEPWLGKTQYRTYVSAQKEAATDSSTNHFAEKLPSSVLGPPQLYFLLSLVSKAVLPGGCQLFGHLEKQPSQLSQVITSCVMSLPYNAPGYCNRQSRVSPCVSRRMVLNYAGVQSVAMDHPCHGDDLHQHVPQWHSESLFLVRPLQSHDDPASKGHPSLTAPLKGQCYLHVYNGGA